MTPESETTRTNEENTPTELPKALTLFLNGWQYTKKNLALVGVLSIPFVVVDILTYFDSASAESVTSSVSSNGVLVWVSFFAMIGYVLLMATALYLVTHQERNPLFAEGFAWAKKHFLSVLWMSVLTGFVVWGGFVLLLVPGIIVATYVALSQIVLAAEGSRGMSALLRSRELVYGNWLAVFRRLVGVQLLYFVAILLIGVIVGTGSAYLTSEPLSEFIVNVLFTVLGSAGTLIFLSSTYQLYSALKVAAESAPTAAVPSASTKYQFLGWFGLGSLILTIGLLGVVAVQTEVLLTTQDTRVADAVLTTELKLVQFEADQYYTSQPEPSYAGVCNEVQSLVSGDKTVACSESADAYAVSVQSADTTYCVDSTGYDKIIYTDLGERTRCLDI